MARVFLSYARSDAEAAKALADHIARAGHDVWWDREIEGGSRFAVEIDKALQNADFIVVLWSEASIQSAWVQDEASEGRDSGRLVPLTLNDVRPPLGFRQYQAIPFEDCLREREPKNLDKLLRAIGRSRAEDQPRAGSKAPAVGSSIHSICVLPFSNMSADPEQEYFSDGITEDIITDLSKVSALAVVARNTAFSLKGQAVDVKDVGREFDVSSVLEGSVRKVGNRVRITAQLIEAKSGLHLWADRFDRELTDIFAIQDEISQSIVEALRLKLLPDEKQAIETRGTANADAYSLVLMARHQWAAGACSIKRDETIIRLCEEAATLDENYAEAFALMALAQSELRFWHGQDVNALPAAERALSINPDLAEARCVKAHYLEEEGALEESMEQFELALKLQPDSWEVNRETARALFRRGRIADSVPYFEKATALMDCDFASPFMLVTCFQARGDEAAVRRTAKIALDRAESALAEDPVNGAAIAAGATALAVFGDNKRAKEWIQRGLTLDPDNLSMRYNLACVLVMELKDKDAAIGAMEPFFRLVKSPRHLRHLEADPDFDDIRDDPRFQQMLKAAQQRLSESNVE